jgi:chromosomal replication initiator protein
MNSRQIWQATLAELKGQVTRANYDTWLRHTRVLSARDGRYVIAVPNSFARGWLEGYLLSQIETTLSRLVGKTSRVEFAVEEDPQEKTVTTSVKEESSPTIDGAGTKTLKTIPPIANAEPEVANWQPVEWGWAPNPRYTFDAFIEGGSNRLALAAAKAVGNAPAQVYNPLFIYGGVGVGKTHLLHAIAHQAIAADFKVMYAPADRFLNELVVAIQERRTEDFRQRYRSVKVLLLDDIEFIAGKERTQEEFFHTFNSLYESGSHIVLTSDRPPRAIATLEDRLRSRFEGGLVADIQPPEFETRLAILQHRVKSRNLVVDSRVLQVIAQRCRSSIRELEGALTRILACAEVEKSPVTVDLANRALDDLEVNPVRRYVTTAIILQAVARHYGLEVRGLTGKRRSKDVVGPRQVAMYLLREVAGSNLSEIGRELGNRDHSTINYGYERVKAGLDTDGQLRQDVLAIRELIYTLAKP